MLDLRLKLLQLIYSRDKSLRDILAAELFKMATLVWLPIGHVFPHESHEMDYYKNLNVLKH